MRLGRSLVLVIAVRTLQCVATATAAVHHQRRRPFSAFPSAAFAGFFCPLPPFLFLRGQSVQSVRERSPVVSTRNTMPPAPRVFMKRKATATSVASQFGPGTKRAKHSTVAAEERKTDEDALVIIEEGEGEGAFSRGKSSYSAVSDPETGRLEAAALGIPEWRVKGALQLFAEGSTVPFIARYRKEVTGGMDENQLRTLMAGMERRQKVGDRRAAILDSLAKAKVLTPKLSKALNDATSLAELEDIYLPLRPKRKTRASDARDKGLDDLARAMMGLFPAHLAAPPPGANPYQTGLVEWLAADAAVTARRFLKHQAAAGDRRAEGLSAEDALAGARDILAQTWVEEAEVRKMARDPRLLRRALQISSKERKKGADEEGNYKTYHDYSRALSQVPPHAILALARGERDKILSLKFLHGDREKGTVLDAMRKLLHARAAYATSAAWKEQADAALNDGIDRLLLPSLEREWWRESLETAEEASFKTFALNLRARLLQPPVKGRAVLGIDPGLRTGCKAALVSSTGLVQATLTFYPQGAGSAEAGRQLADMLKSRVAADAEVLVALGNGKGSREAESFVRGSLAPLMPRSVSLRLAVVDEGGASVYSASELAGKELPGMDVTIRGAVSIARRLQDPLGELVKIEPKALGVGLYQHDVNQKRLSQELSDVVESAVNAVGVDVNTASPALLQYVAGLNAKVAKEVVEERERSGAFVSREAIKKVKGLGPKTFLQAAGFLRVYGSSEALDATAIHPESYRAAKAVLTESLLLDARAPPDAAAQAAIKGKLAAVGVEVGDMTLADIIDSLRNAGRDPRETLLGVPPPILDGIAAGSSTAGGASRNADASGSADGSKTARVSIDDLAQGMALEGVVRNVVPFGSFIDIGVQQDALLHVSKMARGAPPLQVGQRVKVVVENIEKPKPGTAGKTRISLRI